VLLHNDTGGNNTAIGFGALEANIDGQDNIAIGQHALGANNSDSTGGGNIALGAFAGNSVTTANNVICIGASVFGANVGNSCYIANIWTQPGGFQAVFVNADGKLGAQVSSRRFKGAIKPLGQASEALFALKPVSFRYKKEIDSTAASQFGLVAEDVEKVNRDLVVRDKEGKAYSVRYDQVNEMLLNEFLKEHKKVQELEATMAKQEAVIAKQQKDFQATATHQQKQIEALAAGLQKVSAELEVNKAAPQTVKNTD